MKKIISGVLASTLLFSGLSNADASGTGKNAPVTSNTKTAKPILPNLKNKADAQAVINGTYKIKGIGLNNTYTQMNKTFGYSKVEEHDVFAGGMIGSSEYMHNKQEFGFFFTTPKKDYVFNNLKIKSVYVDYTNKNIKYNDIKSNLGKPVHQDLTTFSNKNKNDDELQLTYKNANISLVRPKGTWVVSEVYMETSDIGLDGTNTQPSKGKLYNVEIKPLTNQQLSAMKNGKFVYYKVKPGMKFSIIKKTIGDAVGDNIKRDLKYQYVTSEYGQEAPLVFEYKKQKRNAKVQDAVLDNMMFDYYDKNYKLSSLDKVLGKYTYSKVHKYKQEGTNEMMYSLTREYGKHVAIYAEKEGKTWYVKEIYYK
ncbi:hypothetical protein [Macrococcoides canis]|uniref:hypothetical protein n=1 Tax=Macrococcoides canis TaxID=1855823 RepID=UPI0020B7C73C|nr:hypothetical protein [Macrococcus canis]UTG99649.1 hypothetical protein KFV04_09150 [Macrococcus canis]